MPTSEGLKVKPFDIVVVPFPYSERPALVVSSTQLHDQGYLWIAMITGAGKPPAEGDLPIADLSSTGLPGASIVRAIKIATIEPSRILRRIGQLAASERATVMNTIAGFLASAG